MTQRSAEDLGRLVGRRVRELRQDRGWQQIDLEAHLDAAVTRSTISYIENAQTFFSKSTLNALARAFEVPEAALFLDSHDRRERIALAVLGCPEELLNAVGKLVDVT